MKKQAPKINQPPSVPSEALRWTEVVLPDVMIPMDGLAKGFLHNSYAMRVEPACSTSVSHAFGRDDQTTTQHPKRLFSTKLRALQAMRNDIEHESAKKLNEIDLMIAAISTDSTTT